MVPFIIVQTSTTTNRPYAGPFCAPAGVRPGLTYATPRAAARDAARLNRVCPGAFTIQPKSEQAAWEAEQIAHNLHARREMRWECLLFGRVLDADRRAAYDRAVAGVESPLALAA